MLILRRPSISSLSIVLDTVCGSLASVYLVFWNAYLICSILFKLISTSGLAICCGMVMLLRLAKAALRGRRAAV
jgi:hypothetical protein